MRQRRSRAEQIPSYAQLVAEEREITARPIAETTRLPGPDLVIYFNDGTVERFSEAWVTYKHEGSSRTFDKSIRHVTEAVNNGFVLMVQEREGQDIAWTRFFPMASIKGYWHETESGEIVA